MWTITILVLLTFISKGSGDETFLLACPQAGCDVDAATGESGGWYQIQYPSRNESFYYITAPNSQNFKHVTDETASTSGIEDKAIVVNASRSVSIYVYGANIFYFSPLPICALDVKYIVSLCHPSSDYNSVLVIASHSLKTDVNITFRLMINGSVTYSNRTYTDGETLTLSLSEYQTFTMNSEYDLSGTVINSRKSIAVFSGTRFLDKVVAYDQLLPVKHHGQEYVVAVDGDTLLYELQITGEYSDTHILFNNGSVAVLDGNGLYRQMLAVNGSLSFNTTKPVLTTLCKGNGQNNGFLVVPPISLSIDQAAFYGFSGTFKILVPSDQLNASSSSSEIKWKDIPGSRFTVGTRPSTRSIASTYSFVVLFFVTNFMYNGGYNFTCGKNTFPTIDMTPTSEGMITEEITLTTGGMTEELIPTTGGMTEEITSTTGGMITEAITPITGGMTEEITPTGGMTEKITPTTGGIITEEITTTGGMTEEITPKTGGSTEEIRTTTGGITEEIAPITEGMIPKAITPTTPGMTEEIPPSTGGMVSEAITPTTGGMTEKITRTTGGMITEQIQPKTGGMIDEIRTTTGGRTEEITPITGGMITEQIETTGGMTEDITPTGGMTEKITPTTGEMTEEITPTGGMTEKITPTTGGMITEEITTTGGMTEDITPKTGGSTEGIRTTTGGITEEITAITEGMIPKAITPTTPGMTEEITPSTGGMTSEAITSTTGGMTEKITPTTVGMITEQIQPKTGVMIDEIRTTTGGRTEEITPITGGMLTEEITPITGGMIIEVTTPTTGGMVTDEIRTTTGQLDSEITSTETLLESVLEPSSPVMDNTYNQETSVMPNGISASEESIPVSAYPTTTSVKSKPVIVESTLEEADNGHDGTTLYARHCASCRTPSRSRRAMYIPAPVADRDLSVAIRTCADSPFSGSACIHLR